MRVTKNSAGKEGPCGGTAIGLTRRSVLAHGIGLLSASAVLQAPFIGRARAARSIRISTYGGFFEEAFKEHIFPEFTKASGIEVISVPQPEGTQFLIQLAQANKSGVAPMDLCCTNRQDVLRGQAQSVWRAIDRSKVPNLDLLPANYVSTAGDGVIAVGVFGFYTTLVINTNDVNPAPDSWAVFWESRPNAWGLQGGGLTNLFEITANLFFGGNDILGSEKGIDEVLAKMAEVKPNVRLWWHDEGTMQTALQNDEVVGGMYLHDVAQIMINSGTPIRSIFPKEGGVQGFISWTQPSASTAVEEAQEFVNFSCTPQAQGLIAKHIGSTPLLPRDKLDLTDAEFAAVASTIPPIPVAAESRVKLSEYMEQQFTKMVTS